jgi:hypothetical protein
VSDYDGEVSHCKHQLLKLLAVGKEKLDMLELGTRVTELHQAHDAQTSALVRQRDERDRLISNLLNQLAEARKR